MRLNVLGLVSIDTLLFSNGDSYIGGGALGTAFISSLWDVQTKLFSVSGDKAISSIIMKNANQLQVPLEYEIINNDKPITQFLISVEQKGFHYKINNLYDAQNELETFLIKVKEDEAEKKYIKLPAYNIINSSCQLTNVSINPQGQFDMFSLLTKTDGVDFIFLNEDELIRSFNAPILDCLNIINKGNQSYVITLGSMGAICYMHENNTWFYCPVFSLHDNSSTLGCGDAFAGAFLSAYYLGHKLPTCLARGALSAYITTFSPNNITNHWMDRGYLESLTMLLEQQVHSFNKVEDYVNYINMSRPMHFIPFSLSVPTQRFIWQYES